VECCEASITCIILSTLSLIFFPPFHASVADDLWKLVGNRAFADTEQMLNFLQYFENHSKLAFLFSIENASFSSNTFIRDEINNNVHGKGFLQNRTYCFQKILYWFQTLNCYRKWQTQHVSKYSLQSLQCFQRSSEKIKFINNDINIFFKTLLVQ